MKRNCNDKVFAAIDIGSNAVRLLIKELVGHDPSGRPELKKLLLLRVPLRLGGDVFARGRIGGGKARDLRRLMKVYRQLMKIFDVDYYRACATSAMRDAANGKELISKVEKSCGIHIEIIDGGEEAEIVLSNRLECGITDSGTYLFVDVGGGSTELNLLAAGKLVYSISFNIGTVRSLAGKVQDSECGRFRIFLKKLHVEYPEVEIIGSGGNINKLYRLAKVKDEKTKTFPVDELRRLYEELSQMDLQERMEKFDLKPDRADVIIPAARIFLTVSDETCARKIRVPVMGVADGIIDSIVERYSSICQPMT